MNGVTVLNSYTTDGMLFSILVFVGALILFLLCIRDFVEGEKACGVLLLILSLVLFGTGAFFLCIPSRTCYEVTINDEVTLKEFQEHYKIVNQRGDIYVVEERDLK